MHIWDNFAEMHIILEMNIGIERNETDNTISSERIASLKNGCSWKFTADFNVRKEIKFARTFRVCILRVQKSATTGRFSNYSNSFFDSAVCVARVYFDDSFQKYYDTCERFKCRLLNVFYYQQTKNHLIVYNIWIWILLPKTRNCFTCDLCARIYVCIIQNVLLIVLCITPNDKRQNAITMQTWNSETFHFMAKL